jgi:hypothetical protein
VSVYVYSVCRWRSCDGLIPRPKRTSVGRSGQGPTKDCKAIDGWMDGRTDKMHYNYYYYYYYYYYWTHLLISYVLQRFIPDDKILLLYFLLKFFRNKIITVALLWILLVSVYPLRRLRTLPPLTSRLNVALLQGASQLQTASADL